MTLGGICRAANARLTGCTLHVRTAERHTCIANAACTNPNAASERNSTKETKMKETEVTLKKLLALRLTKFEYGFCLGLLGHEPTPVQQATLDKIINRYAQIWAEKENNDYRHATSAISA